MSLVRCICCMLSGKDNILIADKIQTKNHIKYQHDYKELKKAARLSGLIAENENRGRDWFAVNLADLSIVSQGVFQ